ncbi:cytochrome c oxidase assembly protein [Sphingobium sp. YBL2]|uniref:cytochrome c oxidase assembly protein n=1 Tax=Sphingobium sp. (strain YBL2) TaxID=484429 RepID=UPI0005CC5D36|nr:cytochrome c oxidase assembly protein [Sphingobium sp. YBL2]AJR23541.1 membrane protein [Sphingobium sp. YBL2]
MEPGSGWIPYCGPAPAPVDLLTRWNFDPVLLAAFGLAIMASLRLRSADGRSRSLSAILLLAFLFISPLCALTSALFSARTLHHLVLTSIAAPLLAMAFAERRAAGGVALWTCLHAAALWSWHIPGAYAAALSDHAVYWTMQGSLLLTALALWRGVMAAPLPLAVTALLATMLQMGLLGALLTFSSVAVYSPHFISSLAWGLTPLEDQQLAGLLMWVPGAGLYIAAVLFLLSRWFRREREAAAMA